MRHLIGIALAIVMVATVFPAAAWGYQWLRSASLSVVLAGGGSVISGHRTLAALIAVAPTGLLAGILVAAPRISPLAAGLPGLLLPGWTALYVVSTRHAPDLISLRSHVYGTGFEATIGPLSRRSAGRCGATGAEQRRANQYRDELRSPLTTRKITSTWLRCQPGAAALSTPLQY